MILLLLVWWGLARALPPESALLGPAGLFWLEADLEPSRGRVAVDPRSGALLVEESDGVERRLWDGRAWSGGEGQRMELEGGQRRAVLGLDSLRRRYFYDEQGRLVGLLWPDGGQLAVRYDAQGRVQELAGPGPALRRLSWSGEEGRSALLISDEVGRQTRVLRRRDGAVEQVEVEAPGGSVSSRWTAAGALLSWITPRGGEHRLDLRDGRRVLTLPSGATWTWSVEPNGRISELFDPMGGAWRWERDPKGRLKALIDPAGRVTRWERDAHGRVVGRSGGGRSWGLQRDEAGRLTGLQDARGGLLSLERDAAGRVRRVLDPTGQGFLLERSAEGQVVALVGPSGGRWQLLRDRMGRVVELLDPEGHRLSLSRGSTGRLERLVDSRWGELRLGRGVDGRLSRIVDAQGRALGLVRDAAGRVSRLRYDDGDWLGLSWDRAGALVGLEAPAGRWDIARDLSGQVVGMGNLRWQRDGLGRISGMQGPGLIWQVARDPGGLISRLRSGDWSLELLRNGAGEVLAWQGTDGQVRVERDALGSITAERVEGSPEARGRPTELRLLRDSRGRVSRMEVEGELWAYGRDLDGRLLRMEGPQGLRAGLDRGLAGRVELLRSAGGAVLTQGWSEGQQILELRAADSRLVTRREVLPGPGGRPREARDSWSGVERWVRDPRGGLLAAQLPGGSWGWGQAMRAGPEGDSLEWGPAAGWVRASLREGQGAYGLGRELSAVWDESGHLLSVRGARQGVELRHGSRGLVEGMGAAGRLHRDARGRPLALVRGGLVVERFLWSPTGFGVGPGFSEMIPPDPDDPTGLLRSGPGLSRRWLSHPGGPSSIWDQGRVLDLVAMESGDPAWALEAGSPARPLGVEPGGRARSGLGGLAGAGGMVQLPGGGLLVGPTMELDPVSGRPASGEQRWPWLPEVERHSGRRREWDPALWGEGSWGQPLRELAPLLGLLTDEELMVTPGPELEPAWAGVPASWEGGGPPLGPGPRDWPWQEDPLVTALILHLLPGAPLPSPELLPCLIVLGEFRDLDVPVGIPVEALRPWRESCARSALVSPQGLH